MAVCIARKADGSSCTHPGKHAREDGHLVCGYHRRYTGAPAAPAPAPVVAPAPVLPAALPAPALTLRRSRRLQHQRPEVVGGLQWRMREEPVVFERDPEGGILLAAFAQDAQNVHRSSVQSTTQEALKTLLTHPVAADQDTLSEVYEALAALPVSVWETTRKTARSQAARRDHVLQELTENYFATQAFGTSYGKALDRVWAHIRTHAHKQELVLRLAQECSEGVGMCSNGKMTRLLNVLQGFDILDIAQPCRELFQNKIAAIANLPIAKREAEARALFVEFAIPAAEQSAWLEPLLDM